MGCYKSTSRYFRPAFFTFLLCYAAINVNGYPSSGEFVDREYSSPGAHQLASWLASQLRTKEYVAPIEVPIIPYRLPVQGKRNSEMSNAIIGSEETQKMYRDGKR